MLFLFLFHESFVYAINSLVVNKLRTFLSLLGITIGIFAIISVFTVIDSLENSIRTSISGLGENVIYVQKWPWAFGSDYPWWKYLNRPVPTLGESEQLRKMSKLTKTCTFMVFSQKNIQFRENTAENVQITSAEYSYRDIKNFEIAKGRYFSPFEYQSGKNAVIVGSAIAEQLFKGVDPIGKIIKIGGNKMEVIGVFLKEGEDMFGLSTDKIVFVSVNYMRNIVNMRSDNLGPLIMVKPIAGISAEELQDELRGIMRSIRRLSPASEENFALNQASLISKGFEGIFSIVDITGMIIGGFSILVGGFGIANIMFVSVKEQTKLIGIQKALGAKRYFIMLQFLFEAVILSLMGGGLGLLIVFIGTEAFSNPNTMEFSMSMHNVITGLSLSITIGVLAGLFPALRASKLDPVEAIASV
jgi:putative ABC transport system permease protein